MTNPTPSVEASRPTAPPSAKARSGFRRRRVDEADFASVAALLSRGFADRPEEFWHNILDWMRTRSVPDGFARYGFALESEGRMTGVILTVYSEVPQADGVGVRCNLSSWFVEPEFRGYASMLYPSREPGVTYVNVSPAPMTWQTIEAQGFRPLSDAKSLTFPVLGRADRGARIRPFTAVRERMPRPERELISAHVAQGCFCTMIEADGHLHPFVFKRIRVTRHALPSLLLVYCRDVSDFARFAGNLGRHLLRKAMPSVVLNGPRPAGVPGVAIEHGARVYARGPNPPHSGDCAFTEHVFL